MTISKVLRIRPNPYGLAIATVAAATVLTQWLNPVLDAETYAIFDAVVAISAWYGGMTVGLLTVALSVLAISTFLLNSQQIFTVSNGENIWHLLFSTLIFLLIVFLTSELQAARYRFQQVSDRTVQHKDKQLRMALAAARMGTWHWDMVTGELTWSAEHAAILGLAPSAFDGRYETFEACLHPSDRDRLNQSVQRAIRQRSTYRHEYRVVWNDGSIHWVEGLGEAVYNEAGIPVQMCGTVMNIDHRKQAEDNLRQYERMVDTTPDLMALVDRSYTYQVVNRAYLLRFQKRYEQVVGHSIPDIVGSPVFETECKPRLDRALAGERVQFQLWYDFPIAKRRFLSITYTPYVEPDHSISGAVVTIRDLTDLQQAETGLRQSEEHLRQILQHMPVMLDAFDANGTIICWNQECERVTSFTAEEVIGNPTMMEVFYPDAAYRQQMMADWEKRGHDYRNWEWELTCKDGSTRTIAWSNLSGQFPVPGWVSWGVGVDVTERKQAEAVLRRLNADLERQITEFTAKRQPPEH
ncbi:MAG: PAS domain S-box protein [Leptolyngbyaceae cyanobacterium RU_5_1]|nr:PAS domain S-box protein [Leptolyngbyaceae cyanobacterium RU_5_1]